MKSIPKRCLEPGCHADAIGASYCPTHQQRRRGRRGPGASKQFIALRRKVLARDNYTCRAEGCTRSYGLEVHKIGGGYHAGTIDQYIALCPEHHRIIGRAERLEAELNATVRPRDHRRDDVHAEVENDDEPFIF
jgi:hypothetical protein